MFTQRSLEMHRSGWGYLVPFNGENAFLLKNERVVVGSSEECDVTVKANKLGCKDGDLSKKHFTLVHNQMTTTLKDESKRGTYVNLNLVGNGKQVMLVHNATISLSAPNVKAFIYVDKAGSDSSHHDRCVKKKYMFGHPLGEGGFGQVYLGVCKITHKKYAIKIVENTRVAMRECDILQEVDHPCIIHNYNIIYGSQKVYFVLEYVAGGDLSRWVNDKKLLNESQTKLIFYQLSLAVQYLHNKLICHRDLKPANILMVNDSPESLIKVTDFGLAKDEEMHSYMTTCAGTEAYVAPEVLKHPVYDKKVDIWGMGVILFYSLSGALPFYNLNSAISMNFHPMYSFEKWKGISISALTLVKELLEINPNRRCSIDEVLSNQWLKDNSMKSKAQHLMVQKSVKPERLQVPSSSPQVVGVRPKILQSPGMGYVKMEAKDKVRKPNHHPKPVFQRNIQTPLAVKDNQHAQVLAKSPARVNVIQQIQVPVYKNAKFTYTGPKSPAGEILQRPAQEPLPKGVAKFPVETTVHGTNKNYAAHHAGRNAPKSPNQLPSIYEGELSNMNGLRKHPHSIKHPVVHHARKQYLEDARNNLRPINKDKR